MEPLSEKRCVPCEGGMVALSRAEFAPYLEQTPKWGISDQDRKLEREFEFENFEEALKFVNAVGEIAEYEGHHPNIYLHSWNKVKLILYTHAIGGLSDNDFVLAAKIDDI